MLGFRVVSLAEHGDSITHTHQESCEVAVRQIFPLGGPYNGNTAVTISGRNFQDVGDVKCRFGVDEVNARLVTSDASHWVTNPRGTSFPDVEVKENVTVVECSSPGCRSPTCLKAAHLLEVAVPLEVSMNGVTFTGSGLHFTYYDWDAVHVSLLTPRGGPRHGNTQLYVQGAGFRDLGSGVNGVLMHGVKCKFGENDMVNATKAWGDRFASRCVAPVDTNFVGTPGTEGRLNQTLRALPLELTFNGYDTVGTLTDSNVPYTYYDESALNVSRVHPLGGPTAGGTQLTVYLADDSLLVDLGGGARGLYCRFSYTEPVSEFAHEGVVLRHVVVNASLTDCAGARACGEGGGALECKVPPHTAKLCDGPVATPTCEDARNVTVDVSLNGQQFSSSGITYEYYDESVWRLHTLAPRGGPLSGNTSLVLSGMRLKHLGDVRCRFSVLNPEDLDAVVVHGTVNNEVAAGYLHQECGCESLLEGFCNYVQPDPCAHVCTPSLCEMTDPDQVDVLEAAVKLIGGQTDCTDCAACHFAAMASRKCAEVCPVGTCDSYQDTVSNAADCGQCGACVQDDYDVTADPYRMVSPGTCQSCAPYAQREDCAKAMLPARGAEDCKRWCFPRQHILAERTHAMSRVACVTPTHWRQQPAATSGARVGFQEVEVEVTLNGQDYVAALPHTTSFTYYPVDATPHGVSVHSLSPRGGPSMGGTLVRVNGTGFHDYVGSGAEGRGALWCKWEGEPHVLASREDSEHVLCRAPPTRSLSLLNHTATRRVEVTLNGQLRALTSAAVAYEYYLPQSLRVSAIYPRGGARAGGAAVTVWGQGFRDLDHGAGLHCQFGDADFVPATVQSGTDGGDGHLYPATDGQKLVCMSPAQPASDSCESVPVRVTLNGDNPSDALGTSRSQPCCVPETGGHFSEDVLFTLYDTHEGENVGTSTPWGHTLPGDPSDWTGNDMP